MAMKDATTAAEGSGGSRTTVVGLFEDQIDGEQAMVALRKASHPADRVSLIVRDAASDHGRGADRGGAVARAIAATSLDAVGDWLHGLASLIVPERGTFLVAGPIGAALAGIGRGGASADDVAGGDLNAGGLERTLAEFGFSADETTYLEHRLVAGVALLAVTAQDADALQSTRRLFAAHNAVHIGLATTHAAYVREAEALLNARPESSSGGDVVVTDAVAPLRRISIEGGSPYAAALMHRKVVDDEGDEVGKVEEVIEEADAAPEAEATVRCLVVGFGGVLGFGHHRAAVPADRADLDANPIRLRVAKSVLHDAPAFDTQAPLSRREERAVCAYFGLAPYWPDA